MAGLGQCNEDFKSNHVGCCQNERLYQCLYPCKINTCEKALGNSAIFQCKFVAQKAKKPYCDCDDGFYRNPNGDCVSKEECRMSDRK